MTNTMTYKGYAAWIEYDDEAGVFMGQIDGARDLVDFRADTVKGLREAFYEAVKGEIETSVENGKKPEKTNAQQLSARINRELRHKAVLAAEMSGKSLNLWVEEVFDQTEGRGVDSSEIQIGKLTIDLSKNCAFAADKPVRLTGKEYELLEALAMRKGQTVTKENLMGILYNHKNEPGFAIIDVFVCKLRKKLAEVLDGEDIIDTIWGRGYTIREVENATQERAVASRAEAP